jgi:hypothetical protein
MKKEKIYKYISPIYGMVRKDIRTKALFFLISIFLWFSITLEKDYETSLVVPIKYSGLSKKRTFETPVIKSAKLKIRGKGRTLFSESNDLYFQVDLTNAADSNRFILNSENFINYSEREIHFLGIIYPEYVDVNLDSLILKRVEVVPNVEITTESGYTIPESPKLFPREILLKGPTSIVGDIDTITTERVIVDNLVQSFDKVINLKLPDSRVVKSSATSVNYSAKVVRLGSYTFKNLIRVLNKPKRKLLALDPISVEITVVGPVDKLYQISDHNFEAVIDFNEIDPKTGKAKLRVEADSDLEWRSSVVDVKVTTF